jgi:hypothetical protein
MLNVALLATISYLPAVVLYAGLVWLGSEYAGPWAITFGLVLFVLNLAVPVQ